MSPTSRSPSRCAGIGPTAVLAGSLILGTLLIAPVGLFIDFPGLTERGLLLAALDGLLMAAAYGIAYNAFARCPISIVTPIISCEGAAAAAIAIAFGERPGIEMAVLLVIAVIGVVLVGTSCGWDRGAGIGPRRVVRGHGGGAVGLHPLPRRAGHGRTRRVLGLPLSSARSPRWRWSRSCCGATSERASAASRGASCIWAAGDTGGSVPSRHFAAAASGPVALAGVLAAQFALFGTLAGVIGLGERLKVHQWVGVGVVVAAVTGIAAVTA